MNATPRPASISEAMSRWRSVLLPMPVLPMTATWRLRSSIRIPKASLRSRNATRPNAATPSSSFEGRAAGGSSSRLTFIAIVSARTVCVAGCQRVASSSSLRRNPLLRGGRGSDEVNRVGPRWNVESPGPVNWPKAPAISRIFLLARPEASPLAAMMIRSRAEKR